MAELSSLNMSGFSSKMSLGFNSAVTHYLLLKFIAILQSNQKIPSQIFKVFDPGHHSLRVGHAGEDLPRAEIPAVVGMHPDRPNDKVRSKPLHWTKNSKSD